MVEDILKTFENLQATLNKLASLFGEVTKEIIDASIYEKKFTEICREAAKETKTLSDVLYNTYRSHVQNLEASAAYQQALKRVTEALHSYNLTTEHSLRQQRKFVQQVAADIGPFLAQVRAYHREQQNLSEQIEKQSQLYDKAAVRYKHAYEELKNGVTGLSGVASNITSVLGMNVGFKAFTDNLAQYKRTVFEGVRISERYGESLDGLDGAYQKISKTTVYSRQDFAELNKMFKEMYLGVPPSAEAIARLAETMKGRLGYSVEALNKGLTTLLNIQQRLPDIIDRVTSVQKAYALSTEEGNKQANALYYTLMQMGMSRQEIEQVMNAASPKSGTLEDLMSFEKRLASVRKEVKNVELEMAEKFQATLEKINETLKIIAKPAGYFTTTIGALSSILSIVNNIGSVVSAGRNISWFFQLLRGAPVGVGGFNLMSMVTTGGGMGGFKPMSMVTGGGGAGSFNPMSMVTGGGGAGSFNPMSMVTRRGGSGSAGGFASTLGGKLGTAIGLGVSGLAGWDIYTQEKARGVSEMESAIRGGAGAAAGMLATYLGGPVAGIIVSEIAKQLPTVSEWAGKKWAQFIAPSGTNMERVEMTEKHQAAIEHLTTFQTTLFGKEQKVIAERGAESLMAITKEEDIVEKVAEQRERILSAALKDKDEQQKIAYLQKLIFQGLISRSEVEKQLNNMNQRGINTAKLMKDLFSGQNMLLRDRVEINARILADSQKQITQLQLVQNILQKIESKYGGVVSEMATKGLPVGNIKSVQASLQVAAGAAAANLENIAKQQEIVLGKIGATMSGQKGFEMPIDIPKKMQDEYGKAVEVLDKAKEKLSTYKKSFKGVKEEDYTQEQKQQIEKYKKNIAEAEKQVEESMSKIGQHMMKEAGRSGSSLTELQGKLANLAKTTEDEHLKLTLTQAIEEVNALIAEGEKQRMVMVEQSTQALIKPYQQEITQRKMINDQISLQRELLKEAGLGYAQGYEATLQEVQNREKINELLKQQQKSLAGIFKEGSTGYENLMASAKTLLPQDAMNRLQKEFKGIGEDFFEEMFKADPVQQLDLIKKKSEEIAQTMMQQSGLKAEDLGYEEKLAKLREDALTYLTGAANEYRNITVEINQNTLEQLRLTKELREGWLSAVAEMASNAGVFSEIIGTQTMGVTQFLNLAKGVSAFALGAQGELMAEGQTPSFYTTGGKLVGAKVKRPTQIIVEKQERAEGWPGLHIAGEETGPLAPAEFQARAEDVMLRGTTPDVWGTGRAFMQPSTSKQQGGPISSGYVVKASEAQKPNNKAILENLGAIFITGGSSPHKDDVVLPSLGIAVARGEAILGAENADIGEAINSGMLMGFAGGGRYHRHIKLAPVRKAPSSLDTSPAKTYSTSDPSKVYTLGYNIGGVEGHSSRTGLVGFSGKGGRVSKTGLVTLDTSPAKTYSISDPSKVYTLEYNIGGVGGHGSRTGLVGFGTSSSLRRIHTSSSSSSTTSSYSVPTPPPSLIPETPEELKEKILQLIKARKQYDDQATEMSQEDRSRLAKLIASLEEKLKQMPKLDLLRNAQGGAFNIKGVSNRIQLYKSGNVTPLPQIISYNQNRILSGNRTHEIKINMDRDFKGLAVVDQSNIAVKGLDLV